jgi:choline-sulfatase
MLAGRLPSEIEAYDNGAELAASVPTFAHYLRVLGYQTCLVGKMHFVGPDQLHGFEERLTTDIYPADFGWTANWDHPVLGSGANQVQGVTGLENVLNAGVCARSLQIDFDEEVTFRTVQKLYDLARSADRRPFLLVASYTHPHDPYVVPPSYWDLYRDVDMPRVPCLPIEDHDPHSRFLAQQMGLDQRRLTDEEVRRARRGYYGAVSYVDHQLGAVLGALRSTTLADGTVVIVTADHGDMLGERGLWYKKTFYECAMRVPLIVSAPGILTPRRVRPNVSLVDLLPTVVDLAGGRPADLVEALDGRSLSRLLAGEDRDWPDVVYAEHLDHGTPAPRFMIRQGRFKYVASEAYPSQLFDLDTDADERVNLAGAPAHAETERRLRELVTARWNSSDLHQRVLRNQRRRRFVQRALRQGRYCAWDFQPRVDAASQFVRADDSFPEVDERGFHRHAVP